MITQKQVRQARKRRRLQLVYISIYRVSRHYGGPEEGGWWYDWYTHVKTLPRRVKAHRVEQVKKRLAKMFPIDRPTRRYRVNGGADWVMCVETFPGECKSRRRPHYE